MSIPEMQNIFENENVNLTEAFVSLPAMYWIPQTGNMLSGENLD
jgi:hypothetical protein